jgi:hypothetical protein
MTRVVLSVALLALSLPGCGDDKPGSSPAPGDPKTFDKSKEPKPPVPAQKPG